MSIVFSFLHIAFYYSVATYTDTSPYFSSSKKDFYEFLLSFLQYTLFFYLQVVAAVYLLEYRRLYKERMMKTTQLEKQLAVAKLHSLKMQLNPHFLFNSLNSIHTLMDVELPAAKKMLTRLSRFLRTTLDESEQMEITLQKEMEFIENYLEIEHIRFEDRLKVIYEIEPAVKQTAVPSFILQPLVENAIRHGVAPYAKHVEIIISGTLENDTVCLQVHDNGAGQTGSDSVQAASYTGIGETNGTGAREGIGLKNVRERLELHFGETQTFETCRLPEGGFVAKMTFPFKKAGSGSG
ncbi:MAG: hypothetical protein GY757_50545 [bacterium]|nr:hypothetical protein [bacterium]